MNSTSSSAHPALAAWIALRDSGASHGALVTLVRADGGASSSLGTHLAVANDGRAFGSVTIGGCANGRAIEAAKRAMESGLSDLLTVPLSEEDALALGLACAGDIELLVEPVSVRMDDPIVLACEAAAALLARGTRGALVAPLDGSTGRLLVQNDGSSAGRMRYSASSGAALVIATQQLHAENASSGVHYSEGARWFVQLLVPSHTMIVVGATEVAASLCALAVTLGWRTVVVDPREDVLSEVRFALAVERIAAMPAEAVALRLRVEHDAAVVVVAHDYRIERPVLKIALMSDAPYVGMLGSRKRSAAMRSMLLEDGVAEAQVARLRGPIGLSISAQGPAEIAVSILAELIATWRRPSPTGA